MMFWIVNALLVFAVSAFCAGLVIPKIILIAFRKNLFDDVDERKIHKGVVPRLGGLAFKPVVFFTISLQLALLHVFHFSGLWGNLLADRHTLAFSFCAIMMLYIIGIADDLIGIRYPVKFAVQILCGVMLVGGDLYISGLCGIFSVWGMPLWLGWISTIGAVVFIVNAINLIDGIDGLASGLTSVAMILYGVAMLATAQYIYAMLAFATLGVLVPFFYYNVFGDANKETKIFMGDTGSTTIGMVLCILSFKLYTSGAADTIFHRCNPFVLAFSPLIVPCFDVVRVYIHRILKKKNPFLPDKCHIHHKLLALGIPQRSAMAIIIAASAVITTLNVMFSACVDATCLLLMDIVCYTLVNVWISKKINKLGNKMI